MAREFLKKQLALLLPSVVLAGLFTAIVFLGKPEEISTLTLGGFSINLASDILAMLLICVSVVLALCQIFLTLLNYGWARIRDRYWPPVGAGTLPRNHFEAVIEGVEGQKQSIAMKSWPEHQPAARMARSPSTVHLGNANYSVPLKDRRRVRRFVGRRRRVGADQTMRDNVLVVTGEPGAGKSVLGQEIHASLVEGLCARHHALVPIILFASDLTAEMLEVDSGGSPRLQDLLILYFKTFGTARYNRFADFIDTHWHNFDFLIVIDGLDEIAQRSVYEKMQWQLRHIIQAELAGERRRSRKFILSCRLDDNIGAFGEGDSIVLKGLHTERERKAFCANLIRSHELSPVKRRAVSIALSRNSSSLASVDIFRRNPYFLSLLLIYYKDIEPEAIDRSIDFDVLINAYIGREIQRAHAHAAGKPGGGWVRRSSLERCANIFLQYLAYHMMSLDQDDALYGQGPISSELIDGFVSATQSPGAERMSGVWPATIAFLDRLAEQRPLEKSELTSQFSLGHLDETDLLVLDQLGVADDDPETLVMNAFSVIALEGRVEAHAWYLELAREIVDAGRTSFGHPRTRIAALLLARGLVAAQVLRLVSVENGKDGPTVKFRHRRLAEYYAASYFRDRWETLQPLDDSPWMTPVLNLVAAIEGERCCAMAWFLGRLERDTRKPVFAWRSDVTSAAEVAAFAHRGKPFFGLITRLVEQLIDQLARVRSAGADPERRAPARRRDLATERTIINAVDFIAGLDVGPLTPGSFRSMGGFFARERKEPSHLLLYSGRIAKAVSSLAGKQTPWRFHLSSIWKALRDPNVIIGEPREAIENGLGLEWVLCLLYVLLMELAVTAGIGWGAYRLVQYAATPSSAASAYKVALALAFVFMFIWGSWRFLVWRRSPSQAALLARFPLGVGVYAVIATGALLFLALVGIAAAPEAIRRAGRALARLSMDDVRRLLRALRPVVSFAMGWSAAGLIATGGVGVLMLLFGAELLQSTGASPEETEFLRPEIAARLHCPASERFLNYGRPPGPRDSVLPAARREVGILYSAMVAEWENSRCRLKYPRTDRTRSSPTDLLDSLLHGDPLLIPDPQGRAPTFTREDLEALRVAEHEPEFPSRSEGLLGGLVALVDSTTLSSHITEYDRLLNKMWRARATGQVSNLDQGYPVGSAYAGFAVELDRLHFAYVDRWDSMVARRDALRAQGVRALLWWSVLVPGVLLLLVFGLHFRAQRKDGTVFDRLKAASVAEICRALARQSFSDRLRKRLKLLLLSREQISQAEIEAIDDLVQQFSAGGTPRDQHFAVELGAIVPELSNRLARR